MNMMFPVPWTGQEYVKRDMAFAKTSQKNHDLVNEAHYNES